MRYNRAFRYAVLSADLKEDPADWYSLKHSDRFIRAHYKIMELDVCCTN
jgi:hypothetical protein